MTSLARQSGPTRDADAKVVPRRLLINDVRPKLQDVAALDIAEVVAGAQLDQLVLHLQRLVCQVSLVAAAGTRCQLGQGRAVSVSRETSSCDY